jgi:hypothetical protein
MVRSRIQVDHQRLAGRQRLAVHPHAHSFLVRFDHDALLAHPPDQVEGLHRLAPQRQLLHVGRHAPLDRRAQLLVDREEAVRGAHPIQALVRPLVVVVLDPVADALACLLEGLEARPHQEVVFQRLPEPLDLPQGLRMVRRAADVFDVILLHLLLELRPAAPGGVLPPVVGEHFLRRAIVRHGLAIGLQHVGGR